VNRESKAPLLPGDFLAADLEGRTERLHRPQRFRSDPLPADRPLVKVGGLRRQWQYPRIDHALDPHGCQVDDRDNTFDRASVDVFLPSFQIGERARPADRPRFSLRIEQARRPWVDVHVGEVGDAPPAYRRLPRGVGPNQRRYPVELLEGDRRLRPFDLLQRRDGPRFQIDDGFEGAVTWPVENQRERLAADPGAALETADVLLRWLVQRNRGEQGAGRHLRVRPQRLDRDGDLPGGERVERVRHRRARTRTCCDRVGSFDRLLSPCGKRRQ
jgi:hypothetical protein